MHINCMLWMHVINLLAALLMNRLCPFQFLSWWSELLDRRKHPLYFTAWHIWRDNSEVGVRVFSAENMNSLLSTLKGQRERKLLTQAKVFGVESISCQWGPGLHIKRFCSNSRKGFGETHLMNKDYGSLLQQLVIYSASTIYHCVLQAVTTRIAWVTMREQNSLACFSTHYFFIPKNIYSFVSPRNWNTNFRACWY